MMSPSGSATSGLVTQKDCVGVIDDDAAVRKALCLMLDAMNLQVYAYASADEYLADANGRNCCSCLVLDVRLPGMSGLELQKQLLKHARVPAIVFISGHGDIPMAVDAMRNGAVDFLQKPFKEQQLLDCVHKALSQARALRAVREKNEGVAARTACLSPRELAVLGKLLQGLRTKEIASELGRATKTVEEHRANIMRKMHASTIADLVNMCQSNDADR